jgi:hypothetical protein
MRVSIPFLNHRHIPYDNAQSSAKHHILIPLPPSDRNPSRICSRTRLDPTSFRPGNIRTTHGWHAGDQCRRNHLREPTHHQSRAICSNILTRTHQGRSTIRYRGIQFATATATAGRGRVCQESGDYVHHYRAVLDPGGNMRNVRQELELEDQG